MQTWPEAGLALWSELVRFPGRVAFLIGDRDGEVARHLAELRGVMPLAVGATLARRVRPPSEAMVRTALASAPVLSETEILFDPVLALNPVRLAEVLAQACPPLVMVWPGDYAAGGLCFPATVGAAGQTRYPASGHLVLRVARTVFEDEVPYTVERIA